MTEGFWFVQLSAVHIAKSGFAVCATDHPGHGFSDGLVYHIPDNNPVIDDCVSFFDSFRSRSDSSLPSFLFAESLGGAIALSSSPSASSRPYDGIVLNGAMCDVSKKFIPPWPLDSE